MSDKNLPAKQDSKIVTIRDTLESYKGQFASVLPKILTPERLLAVAVSVIARTPKLQECSPASLVSCVMQAAQLGLDFTPSLQLAHMVPYNSNKARRGEKPVWVTEAQFQIGYGGLLTLMRRTGEYLSITVEAVFPSDFFVRTISEAGEHLEHRPDYDIDRTDGTKLTKVYAVLRFKDGGHQLAVMCRNEVESIRQRSKAKDAPAWADSWVEMAKKTVLRRAAKYAPKSTELADVLDHEDEIERKATIVSAVPDVLDGLSRLASQAGDGHASEPPQLEPTKPEPKPEPPPPPVVDAVALPAHDDLVSELNSLAQAQQMAPMAMVQAIARAQKAASVPISVKLTGQSVDLGGVSDAVLASVVASLRPAQAVEEASQ